MPPPQPRLGRALVERIKSAVAKPAATKPRLTSLNLKHVRAQPVQVRRTVCTGIITAAATTAASSRTCSCSATCSRTTAASRATAAASSRTYSASSSRATTKMPCAGFKRPIIRWIRPIKLGRKNALHAGLDGGAERWADRVPDRELQDQRRRSPRLSHGRPEEDRQPASETPNRSTSSLGLPHSSPQGSGLGTTLTIEVPL